MKKVKEIILDKLAYLIVVVSIAIWPWVINFINRVEALENSDSQTRQDVKEIKNDTKIIRCMLKDEFACKSIGTVTK